MRRRCPWGSSSPRGRRLQSRSPGPQGSSTPRGTGFAGCWWMRRGKSSPRRKGWTLGWCCPLPCSSPWHRCRKKTAIRRLSHLARKCLRRTGLRSRCPNQRGKRSPAGTRPASCWLQWKRKSSPPCTAQRSSTPTPLRGRSQRGTDSWRPLARRSSPRGKNSPRGTHTCRARPSPRGSSNPRGSWPAACLPLQMSSKSPPRMAWSHPRCWPPQGRCPRRTGCTRPMRCRTSRPASTCPRGRGSMWRRPCPRGKSGPQGTLPAAHCLKLRCSSIQPRTGSLWMTRTRTQGKRPQRRRGSWQPQRSPCRPHRTCRVGSHWCPPPPRPCPRGNKSPRGMAPASCSTTPPRKCSPPRTGCLTSPRCPCRGTCPRGR